MNHGCDKGEREKIENGATTMLDETYCNDAWGEQKIEQIEGEDVCKRAPDLEVEKDLGWQLLKYWEQFWSEDFDAGRWT